MAVVFVRQFFNGLSTNLVGCTIKCRVALDKVHSISSEVEYLRIFASLLVRFHVSSRRRTDTFRRKLPSGTLRLLVSLDRARGELDANKRGGKLFRLFVVGSSQAS